MTDFGGPAKLTELARWRLLCRSHDPEDDPGSRDRRGQNPLRSKASFALPDVAEAEIGQYEGKEENRGKPPPASVAPRW